MEAPDHSGPMDSFQMAIEDDLCLDLLSAQADMDLLSAQAEMDLLSAQAEMDLLSSQANMDLLPVQTGMNPLPVQTGMDILSSTELLGPEGHCVEQQAIGESTTLLTQSERERQKTQDSLSILGDPDSLELSKAQVEEFYNRTFPEPSSPSTGLSQGLAEATGADPMRDRLEVAEATQSVSGIGMLDAGEEQMDVAHKDSTAPTQYEEMLVSCNVDVNVPSLIKLEGSYFDNSPEKEGAFSDHVLMLQGEEGPGTVDTRPEGAIMISDVSPIPVNEADTLEERGEDLPVGGSVSPQSSNAKSVTSVEESCAETVVTIDGTTVTKDVEMTKKCGRGQQPRHEEMTETTPTVSNKADQQSDNSDASRGLRRSSRSSLRKPQYTTPHIEDPPPSRLITCRPPGQSSAAQRYTQKSWPPPPQPSGLPRQPPRILCATCQGTLQSGQTAYQRKGMPQLFCSSGCLAVFSRKPPRKKPCAFCKQDMGVSKAPLIAQVGQTFQEFCSNTCHSKYEARLEIGPIQEPSSPTRRCSVCNSTREMVHEVSSGNTVHLLCSDVCFTRFRATKGLKTSCCDACGTYINMSACRAEYLLHEGQQKRFCNSSCLRLYKMKNTKVLSCQWCKTLCKNFDMLSKVDDYGKTRLFCSVCCIASHKVKTSGDAVPAEPCSSCRRTLLEPAYYCKANETVYMFCSPGCWTKFQSNSPDGDIHLNCHSCHNMFSGKPEIFEWQDSIYQFCSKECSEDYKRLNGVVSMCEHCKEEKLLHERIKFSGVEKAFCSDGCILLYKQDFTKQLGLCCINCTYCSQTCMRAVTEELDGNTWDFCSEDCKSKYLLWYLKVTRCHACKRQGKLLETIHWRGEIKHYCNQQCLLRFYSQQNQPNLATQQGPESLLHSHSPDSKSPPAATKKSEATGKMKSVATPAPSLPPTSQKNKSSMCKPMMTTTGVSCKPEMRSQGCQTDDYLQSPPLVLPVPVPVFLPLPLQMYCQYTPVTMALPLPLPVPMFLPITLEHVDKMVETIKELKLNIPDDPVESDILAMAALIAEADAKISSDLCGVHMKRTADQDTGPSLADCILAESNEKPCLAESGDDSQDELIKAPLDLNPSVDFLLDCGIVEPHPILAEQSPSMAAHKGPKRLAMSETTLHDPLDCLPVRAGLNSSYGVKAWRSWVQSKHSQSEDGQQKQIEMKEDLLLYGAVELNHGLTQFVKDILSPRGPCYKPDSIFYLCLGIQQYLLENNRMVNIFTDQLYFTFAQELNNIVSKWQPTMSPNGGSESCVLEEHLWECKQLGVYSPFVLLNTLMFFNTKYFGLWTVEQHLQLSFANVTIKAKRTSTPHGVVKSTGVCYQPKSHHKRTGKESSLGKRKRDEPPELEQQENSLNPLRCPVKFFEFYLSKCSNRVRSSCTAFYLQPESTCMADSRLWYSDVPMDRGMMGIMLNRILAVKDIYEGHAGQGDMD